MAAFARIFITGLCTIVLAEASCQQEQDEIALLQLGTAFVPATWRDPDVPLNPGLGPSPLVHPRPSSPRSYALPSWSPPKVLHPFDWPDPASCQDCNRTLRKPIPELDELLEQDGTALLQVRSEFVPAIWRDPDKPLTPGLGPSPRLPSTPVLATKAPVDSFPQWPPGPPAPATPAPPADSQPEWSPSGDLPPLPEWARPAICQGASQYLTNGEGDGTYWRCIVGGNCIMVENRCDGIRHCTDGSDELYCNGHLLNTVRELESTNTELQDEVHNLRTANTERLAEYNTLRATFSALNSSLHSDFTALRSRHESSASDHGSDDLQHELQTEIDILKSKNTQLQNEINAIQTKNYEQQAGSNEDLAEAITNLKTENVDLLTQIAALKEDYVKLQVQLHPG